MKALKEMMILALLAPFAPVFFILGLFEVKWAVQLMNPDANLKYVPTAEELSLLEAIVEDDKARIKAAHRSSAMYSSPGVNPDSGLALDRITGVDANGFSIGGPR